MKTTVQARPSPGRISPFMPARGGVLQRKCACGGTPGPSGECASCERNRRAGVKRLPALQPKLAINVPGDQYEQEADRLADFAVSEPNRLPSRASSRAVVSPLQRDETAAPPKQVFDEAQKPVWRKANGPSASIGAAPPIVHEVLESPGQPLDRLTRGFMESRLAYNFGGVRIHADARAAESARAVNALAYTVGRHVVFGAGQYAPGTAQGQRLLAHELVHTAQQVGAGSLRRAPARPACPEQCLTCPSDGVLPEGCECFGVEQPKMVVPAKTKIRIVQMFGAKSVSSINRDLKQANKTWAMAGIEVDAEIKQIDKEATTKILGTDHKGQLQTTVQIEPSETALNHPSVRALLGLPSDGNEKFSFAAGRDVHSLVVYYVPAFNRCATERDAVGCAFRGSHGGRFFVLVEKGAQDVILAHELGHMWGNEHIKTKRNVMVESPAGGGLDAEQIKKARETLQLGSLRCLATGAPAADQERIETEQQTGQSLVRSITGEWAGTVTVQGEDRVSKIQFSVDSKNAVNGRYWYESPYGSQPGRIMNGVVTAGALTYEWEQGSGQEQSKGRGSFRLMGTRLTGTWGVNQSTSNGGSWSLKKTAESAP